MARKLTIAVIRGDGIGVEVIREAIKVLNAIAVKSRDFVYVGGVLFLRPPRGRPTLGAC